VAAIAGSPASLGRDVPVAGFDRDGALGSAKSLGRDGGSDRKRLPDILVGDNAIAGANNDV